MLTIESLNADKPLYVFLAIHFAEKTLPIWEREYPEDMRPRKAIEAAKECLRDPSNDAAAHAAAAFAAAYAHAANAANAAYTVAAANAASAANAADYAYDYAAYAHAAHAAARSAYAVYAAAYAAAYALKVDKKSLIHELILENLDWILQYKIENGQSFAEPELIFDLLNEEQKQSFLFNLDAVA